MSCLHYTPGLEQTYQDARCQPARPRAGWSWPTLTTLRSLFDALHEAFAAYREYERLRTRGIPHDAAIRKVLGAGPKPSPVRPDAVRALCFAGRA